MERTYSEVRWATVNGQTVAVRWLDVSYSPDDGGWYAEVVDNHGKTLHTTRVYRERYAAQCAARRWLDREDA